MKENKPFNGDEYQTVCLGLMKAIYNAGCEKREQWEKAGKKVGDMKQADFEPIVSGAIAALSEEHRELILHGLVVNKFLQVVNRFTKYKKQLKAMEGLDPVLAMVVAAALFNDDDDDEGDEEKPKAPKFTKPKRATTPEPPKEDDDESFSA